MGSIEEKILQRQIQKVEVADSVVDRRGRARHKHRDRHFVKENLKELFTLKTDLEQCDTVDILRENIKDYQVISSAPLIETMMPSDSTSGNGAGFHIPVMFTRSVDPKHDPVSKWNIKAAESRHPELSGSDGESEDEDEFQITDAVHAKEGSEEELGLCLTTDTSLKERDQ